MIGILRRADPWLTALPITLAAASLVLVYSASCILGITTHGDAYYYLSRRVMHLVLGILAFLFFARLDYHKLVNRHATPLFLAVLVVLAVLAVLGHGHAARGAKRWIGLMGIMVQPTDVARVVVVCFLARYLVRKGSGIRSLAGGFLPALAVGGIAVVLIAMQPNLSSAGVLFGVVLALLWFAGARTVHLAALCAVGVMGFLAMLARYDYQRLRVASFLEFLTTGKLDALGTGWQLDQSLIALGSGGLFGRGYGRSLQKFLFLPDPHTDFILAIIGEEGGLLATGVLVVAFLFLLARGFRAAYRAPDDLGFLLAAGLTVQLAAYTLVNTGVATGLFPTTGLPLPFVSYGGSALVMNLAAAGILVNVSAQAGAVRGVEPVTPRPLRMPRARRVAFGAVGARGFTGAMR